MAARELPITPPKPAYVSMPAAVAAAIAHGNSLAEIRLPKWAETYRTSEEAIRLAWEAELTRKSQQPDNSFDVEGK